MPLRRDLGFRVGWNRLGLELEVFCLDIRVGALSNRTEARSGPDLTCLRAGGQRLVQQVWRPGLPYPQVFQSEHIPRWRSVRRRQGPEGTQQVREACSQNALCSRHG